MQKHNTRRYIGKTLEERFWLNTIVGPFTDCWLWHGPTDGDEGYGRLYVGRHKYIYAHRLSYQLHFGPIPDGLDILHSCDHPCCVNPYHLRLGTHSENMQDMVAKKRLVTPDNHGESNGQSKVTTDDVIEIRALSKSGISQKELAEKFNLSRANISRIIRRERWNHVP